MIPHINRLTNLDALIPSLETDGLGDPLPGDPLLMIMVQAGRLDVIRYLVEDRKVALDVTGNSNYTALMSALLHQYYHCASYLIKQGASVNNALQLAALTKHKGSLGC